jgi:hypothetical protein
MLAKRGEPKRTPPAVPPRCRCVKKESLVPEGARLICSRISDPEGTTVETAAGKRETVGAIPDTAFPVAVDDSPPTVLDSTTSLLATTGIFHRTTSFLN